MRPKFEREPVGGASLLRLLMDPYIMVTAGRMSECSYHNVNILYSWTPISSPQPVIECGYHNVNILYSWTPISWSQPVIECGYHNVNILYSWTPISWSQPVIECDHHNVNILYSWTPISWSQPVGCQSVATIMSIFYTLGPLYHGHSR